MGALTTFLRQLAETNLPTVAFIGLLLGLVCLVCLVVSTIAAIVVLRTKELQTGLDGRDVLRTVEPPPDRAAVLLEIIQTYAICTVSNQRVLNEASRWIEGALWSLLAGVLSLSTVSMRLLLESAPW